MSDPDGALIVANSIGSVVGDGNSDGESSVGLEVGTKAVDATEVNLAPLSLFREVQIECPFMLLFTFRTRGAHFKFDSKYKSCHVKVVNVI